MTDRMRMSSAGPHQPPEIVRVAHWALCVSFGLVCSGCLALAVGAAGGAAGAVYVMGKLKDEFDHPVPVVHDATVAALNDLGLKPSEDRVDKLSAHMESAFSDGPRVWIDLESVSDSRCRVTIRVGLTGDEVRSRKIYDAIKQHLPPSQSRDSRLGTAVLHRVQRGFQSRVWQGGNLALTQPRVKGAELWWLEP